MHIFNLFLFILTGYKRVTFLQRCRHRDTVTSTTFVTSLLTVKINRNNFKICLHHNQHAFTNSKRMNFTSVETFVDQANFI